MSVNVDGIDVGDSKGGEVVAVGFVWVDCRFGLGIMVVVVINGDGVVIIFCLGQVLYISICKEKVEIIKKLEMSQKRETSNKADIYIIPL